MVYKFDALAEKECEASGGDNLEMGGQIGDEGDAVMDEEVDEGPSMVKESQIGLTTFTWPMAPRSEWPIRASVTETKLQLNGFQAALHQYLRNFVPVKWQVTCPLSLEQSK